MTDSTRRTNEFADRLAGLNDPSMGDERERDIILRAYALTATVGTYASICVGILFALIGAGLWSLLPVLANGLTGVVAAGYCKREGVDLNRATLRTTGRRFAVTMTIGAVLALFLVAVLAYHMQTGQPVIDVGLGGWPTGTTGSSTATGGVIGGIIGGAAVIVFMAIRRRRQQVLDLRDRESAWDAPDEN